MKRLQTIRWPCMAAAALALAGLCAAVHAQDGGLGLADLLFPEKADAAEDVRVSHLSDVHQWTGVAPLKPEGSKEAQPWRAVTVREYPDRAFAAPATREAITTCVAVPEDADYRLWLGYLAVPEAAHPVSLELSGANTGARVFGAAALPKKTGRQIEESFPVRFETGAHRLGHLTRAVVVWEYWDTALRKGATTVSLRSSEDQARVDALFISRNKSFLPSKWSTADEGNLNRTYYRFRFTHPIRAASTISEQITYHWAHRTRQFPDGLWYWTLQGKGGALPDAGGKVRLPAGVWTKWIDATESVTNAGPFATGFLDFDSVREGAAEAQIAWRPHPSAVLKTIRPVISEGRAIFMVPTERNGYASVEVDDPESAAWGMRSREYLARLETATDVAQRHFAFASHVGARPTRPLESIRLYAGCRVPAHVQDAYAGMFRTLGVNWVEGIADVVRAKHGLRMDRFAAFNNALFHADTHCPTDPLAEAALASAFRARADKMDKADPGASSRVAWLKMGDEIGAIAPAAHVNACADCRAEFHSFLRGRLQELGEGPDYYGVMDLHRLDYTPDLPERAGRHDRRLYYDSARFKFLLGARFYGRMTRAAEKVFPRVKTYCNFSPHPPMMSGHMNGSDWFALTRAGGASLAWAEDWATGGSWGIAGIQTVSYYGALVECAARRAGGEDLPSGFYNVASCGRADRKMISLVNRGIFQQALYSFGPLYSLADAANAWSEMSEVYSEIARGAAALAPAEEIIVHGERDPRRIAVLYNRSHEIWQGGYGGYQTDRLLTFLALLHSHLSADILIEEDLTSDCLGKYRVLYVQGFNLPRRHIVALETWVRNGGVLIGAAGTALRDECDERMDDGGRLFGAGQRLAGCSTGKSWHPMELPQQAAVDRARLVESPLTPAVELDVVGQKCVLIPESAEVVGRFADGTCAAASRTLGTGRTLLFGFMPGLAYGHNAPRLNALPISYKADRRLVIAKPALATLGRPSADYSEPLTELCVFRRQSGVAITLNDFSYAPGREATLSIEDIKWATSVVSSLRGPLSWRREGGRILAECPIPQNIDVIIVR